MFTIRVDYLAKQNNEQKDRIFLLEAKLAEKEELIMRLSKTLNRQSELIMKMID